MELVFLAIYAKMGAERYLMIIFPEEQVMPSQSLPSKEITPIFTPSALRKQATWASQTAVAPFFHWLVQRADQWVTQQVIPANAGILPGMVTCLDWAGAWALTSETRYLDLLEKTLPAYCAPREQLHGMFCGLVSTQLAMLLDLAGEALSPDCRTAALDRISYDMQSMLTGLKPSIANEPALAFCNNITAVIASGILLGGYSLSRAGQTECLPTDWLERGREALKSYMVSYYQIDGSTLEGPNYFLFGTEHALLARDALRTLTGEDALNWGLLERGRHFSCAHDLPKPGPYPVSLGLGDCQRNKPGYVAVPLRLGTIFQDATLHAMWRASFMAPETIEAWNVDGFEANTGRDHLLTLFWLTPEAIAGSHGDAEKLPKTMFYPWIGDAFLRSGWSRTDTLVQLHGGLHHPHSRWHYHHDHGSFTICAGGEELLTDPGIHNYQDPLYRGWFTTTRAHNCLTIDQRDQERPYSVTVSHHAESKELSVFSADLSGCYGNTPARRTWAYLKPGILCVFDSIAASPYNAPCYFNLHTEAGNHIEGADHSWEIRGKKAALGLHFAAPKAIMCEKSFSPPHPATGEEAPALRFRTPNEMIELRSQSFLCIIAIAPEGNPPLITSQKMEVGKLCAFEISIERGRTFRVLGNPEPTVQAFPSLGWEEAGFRIMPGYSTCYTEGMNVSSGDLIVYEKSSTVCSFTKS